MFYLHRTDLVMLSDVEPGSVLAPYASDTEAEAVEAFVREKRRTIAAYHDAIDALLAEIHKASDLLKPKGRRKFSDHGVVGDAMKRTGYPDRDEVEAACYPEGKRGSDG